MEQQITYTEKPRGSVGGKVFLILEMIVMIFYKIIYFIATLIPDDAASSIPAVKVIFWIAFFVLMTGYIILMIGTSNRNSIGLLIAGFSIFLLIEWEPFITGFTSLSSFANMFSRTSVLDKAITLTFTFVWVCMIVLACIKKAPKPLCLIPGFAGIIASVLLMYTHLTNIAMWSSLTSNNDAKEAVYTVFLRIAAIVYILIILFRPFWIFLVAHWMTHPTIRVAVRPVVQRVVPQPAPIYVPVQSQPYQGYQQVPQAQPVYPQQPVQQPGYPQVPQQGYPQYGQPQQFPPRQ
jgi:hypothetical protein